MVVTDWAMLAALTLIVSFVFSVSVVAWICSMVFDLEEEETWLD